MLHKLRDLGSRYNFTEQLNFPFVSDEYTTPRQSLGNLRNIGQLEIYVRNPKILLITRVYTVALLLRCINHKSIE